MKKIGVVITDGVGYRNFVLSDFLVEAQKLFDEVVILSYLPSSVYKDVTCRVIELDAYEEKFINWFFRKIKEVAHLQLHKKDNFGIQDNLRVHYTKSKTPRGFATRFIFKFSSVFCSERWIQRYHVWQQLSFRRESIVKQSKELLVRENFNLLFFTHQRPSFIAPLVYQAEQLKVKTCSFIFSWDNLASKGRMAANFDYFLVWSELMKQELLHFYSFIHEQNVQVVGTPQFESYVLERFKSTKEDFFSKFDLNPNKKIICFSCGDVSTSKNDSLYIETIANAISTGIIDAQLIVRTSPAEDAIRFSALFKKYPNIKWNFPIWNLSREGHQETWSQRIPSVEDIKDLRALLENSDLNINMLSTMSLDFMQFDKPVINTVFGNAQNGLYDDQRFLNYAHIVNVVNSNATKIVKNEKELIDNINGYLKNPLEDSENRKKIVQLQVSMPLANTGKRIAETLLKWS